MQQDVDSICAWVDQNFLLLNTLKCHYPLFSRKPTPTLPPSPSHLEYARSVWDLYLKKDIEAIEHVQSLD